MEYVALLRGINLGSNRQLAMPQLRDLVRSMGYPDARTYIQSGNVLLRSERGASDIADELKRAIAERFNLDVPVLVRTADELAAVVAGNPFPQAAADGSRFYAVFLDRDPPQERIAAIDVAAAEPDRFALGDRVIYAWYRGGLRASKLAPAISDRRLGVTTTARNWNTVTKLLALAEEFAAEAALGRGERP